MGYKYNYANFRTAQSSVVNPSIIRRSYFASVLASGVLDKQVDKTHFQKGVMIFGRPITNGF